MRRASLETEFRLEPLGDRGLVIYLKQVISPSVVGKVLAVTQALEAHPLAKRMRLIPAYASVTVLFLGELDLQKIETYLSKALPRFLGKRGECTERVVEIPVHYGGPDLAEVARMHRLSEAQVIRLHSRPVYQVAQIGFTPGFPYLIGLSKKLITPRLDTPRARVAAGSVGIGDAQTGIYSVEGPGGWRIIGKTKISLFDPERKPCAYLAAGMRVRFVEAK